MLYLYMHVKSGGQRWFQTRS